MSESLLLVALGPVQDFIAQARRTRDLWYGSHLLSELGRAAARALVDGGAPLIFPVLPPGAPELEACWGVTRSNGAAPLNIANKVLAQVPDGVDPEGLARAVRESVARFWREEAAGRVRAACSGLLAEGTDDVWDEQIGTFLEFSSAWAPLDSGYDEARKRLERAIASRKLLRDFSPWLRRRDKAPKSSLDGARETVLRPPRERDQGLVHRFRIAESEQLDAVGLVKRAGGEPEQFVPIVNVALASWSARAAQERPDLWDGLKQACRKLGLSSVSRPDLPCAGLFPYDGSVLFKGRWSPVFKELGLTENALDWGRRNVLPLQAVPGIGEPFPYVACLVADGDHMGMALDRLQSPEEHRDFSRRVAGFSGQARHIVEQQHHGVLVYAGGDDVLAFVPLPEALACAEALRNGFIASLQPVFGESSPTLSVGLGIGHVMESMGELLELGREAEKEAKRGRNALAVLVDKRSGGRRTWGASWEEGPRNGIETAVELSRRGFSRRKVYELDRLLGRFPESVPEDAAAWARMLALEVRGIFARVGEGSWTASQAGLPLEEGLEYAALRGRVRVWVERMMVANVFEQAGPRGASQSGGA